MTILEPALRTRAVDGTGADLGELVDRRRAGYSLEAPFYTSSELFRLDVDAIFGRGWFFAASVAEIPEPGDYLTVSAGDTSVIVLRDDDEQLRAFHNVCRHRGTRLLQDSSGSVGNIVCGYHCWAYGTDGALRHAPSAPPDFDRSCFGLKSVPIADVAGLLFICPGVGAGGDPTAEPPADLAEVARIVEPYIAPHQLTRTKVAAQIDLVEEANWKLVMENNRECYHCTGHPELSACFFPTYGYAADAIPAHLRAAYDRYLVAEATLEHTCEQRGLPYAPIEQLDSRPVGFRVQREALDGEGRSFSETGALLSSRLLADFDEPRLGRLSLHVQPNAWFHFLSDHAVTFSVRPIAADRTLLRTTWLVHEDAREGVDYDVDALTHVWRATNDQDSVFCARAQRGVASPAYEPGPYLPNEYQVDAFCGWYVDRLREHLTR